jgi:hypothetical protein
MAIAYEQPRPPHPVAFDVAYPERLSRGLIFVKWLLAIPQFIVVYLLFFVAELLAVIAWFAILITGRYPKSFFEFGSGVLRWQANVMAYVFLLRDEYPPFSWEPGDYPLLLAIPPAERQSRLRLFIRLIAIFPNQIALYFVTLAAFFTTFIAWWAILFTGRYPRGLFKFSVGAMRWQQRLFAYLFLLRDEFPPYSIGAGARPGNEALSAVIGAPLFAAYVAFSLLPLFGAFAGSGATVHLSQQTLATRGALSAAQASATSGNIRVTLLEYNDAATPPLGADVELAPGYRLVGFRVSAEKDGFWPSIFTPYFFSLYDCAGDRFGVDSPATNARGTVFRIFWSGGREDEDVYFQVPRGASPCELRYFAGRGSIRFFFE